jgi:hypothetical protein
MKAEAACRSILRESRVISRRPTCHAATLFAVTKCHVASVRQMRNQELADGASFAARYTSALTERDIKVFPGATGPSTCYPFLPETPTAFAAWSRAAPESNCGKFSIAAPG